MPEQLKAVAVEVATTLQLLVERWPEDADAGGLINRADLALGGMTAALSRPTPDAAMVEVTNALGCFDAAECEGLQEALLDTQDERLKDLVLRRLLYAPDHLRAALEALGQHSECDVSDRCRKLEEALKRLSFAAQTSGGTAGRDEELCAAIANAAALLSKQEGE